MKLLENQNYEQAFIQYEKLINNGKVKDENTFEKEIIKITNENIEKLISENKYDIVLEQLDDIRKFSFLGSIVAELETEIPLMMASQKSLEDGKIELKSKNFEVAIGLFEAVDKTNKQIYQEARTYLDKTYYALLSDTFEDKQSIGIEDLENHYAKFDKISKKFKQEENARKLKNEIFQRVITDSIFYYEHQQPYFAMELLQTVEESIMNHQEEKTKAELLLYKEFIEMAKKIEFEEEYWSESEGMNRYDLVVYPEYYDGNFHLGLSLAFNDQKALLEYNVGSREIIKIDHLRFNNFADKEYQEDVYNSEEKIFQVIDQSEGFFTDVLFSLEIPSNDLAMNNEFLKLHRFLNTKVDLENSAKREVLLDVQEMAKGFFNIGDSAKWESVVVESVNLEEEHEEVEEFKSFVNYIVTRDQLLNKNSILVDYKKEISEKYTPVITLN